MDAAQGIRTLKAAAQFRKDNPQPKGRKGSARSGSRAVAGNPGAPSKEMMDAWFLDRRTEMTGYCQCGCGLTSSKYEDTNYKSSIAHILPKRLFPSVAAHPLNWIEMNFWDGCHTNMDDRGVELWPNMECWPVIVYRFARIYPHIAPAEIRHIPDVLLKTLSL